MSLECEELGQARRPATREHEKNALIPHVYVFVITEVVTDVGDAGSVYLKTFATNSTGGLHFCQCAASGASRAVTLTF